MILPWHGCSSMDSVWSQNFNVSFFKAGPGCCFNTEAGNKTVVSDLKPFQNVVPKFHSFDNGMSNFNFAQHIPSHPIHDMSLVSTVW